MQLEGDLLLTSKVKVPAVIEMPEWQVQAEVLGNLLLASTIKDSAMSCVLMPGARWTLMLGADCQLAVMLQHARPDKVTWKHL